MLIGYIITVILYIVTALTILFTIGSPLAFLDILSFAVSPLLSFLLCLASFKPAEILSAYRAVFATIRPEPAALKKALLFFETFRNYLIVSGILAVIIGNVSMMTKKIYLWEVGRGWATALLCAFYSVLVLILVAFPVRGILQKRLEGGHDRPPVWAPRGGLTTDEH